MGDILKILLDIGNVRCPNCNGWCSLRYPLHYFICQDCGKQYVFKGDDD